jgi:hypothetical protein
MFAASRHLLTTRPTQISRPRNESIVVVADIATLAKTAAQLRDQHAALARANLDDIEDNHQPIISHAAMMSTVKQSGHRPPAPPTIQR